MLFFAILAVDQATKTIAVSNLRVGESVPVIDDMLRWTLTYNPGGAFGVRLGSSTYYLLSSVFIFIVLIFYIWRNRQVSHVVIPLTIVAGGAVGNIIDRVRFGEVVDFIDCEFPDISLGSYHMERWPIFNIADMAVSVGIVVTIFFIFYHSYRDARRRLAEEQTELPPEANN
jgi:signal peptidase II